MAAPLSTDQKLHLITRNLQEIIGLDELKTLLIAHTPRIYFGTATTGKPHIGYLLPLLKIADYLAAGCEVKILFADLHAILDNLKSTQELVELRTIYYEKIIKSVLKNLNVPLEKLTFVRGTSFQLDPKYTMDVYRISTVSTIREAKKSSSEVVKQTDNPKLSGLLYPILQALDMEYLDIDISSSGIDQRKIVTFANDVLPMVGYKKRIMLMNPMLTAINAMPKEATEETNIADSKMSSSNLYSKIDFLDSKNEIKKKVNRAYCLEGDLSFNPLMDLMKLVIFPLLENQKISTFMINRPDKYGGAINYSSYESVEKDFSEKKLHPQDLKMGVIDCINNFLDRIRVDFSDKESLELIKKAYP